MPVASYYFLHPMVLYELLYRMLVAQNFVLPDVHYRLPVVVPGIHLSLRYRALTKSRLDYLLQKEPHLLLIHS